MPRSGWVIREIDDRYRLHKKLKGGAMAAVYLAEDKATTAFYHEVVLKVVHAGRTFEQWQRMIRPPLTHPPRPPDALPYTFHHPPPTQVVLKVLHAGGTFEQRQRMIREVSLVGSVRHPNVIRYMDAAEQRDGTLYIAMEVVQGRCVGLGLRVCGFEGRGLRVKGEGVRGCSLQLTCLRTTKYLPVVTC
jgi:serine/threonine protein kinase